MCRLPLGLIIILLLLYGLVPVAANVRLPAAAIIRRAQSAMAIDLEKIKLADPATWQVVERVLSNNSAVLDASRTGLLVGNTLWALSIEVSLGRALAGTLAGLLAARVPACWVALFLARVRKAAEKGATLARIHALYLAAVIETGEKGLLKKYDRAVEVMLAKGSYTLPETLKLAAALIRQGRLDAAGAYLDLLAAVFGHRLTYNRSIRLVYVVPRAVEAMAPGRCCCQVSQMLRLVRQDVELIDDYIQGLEKGLAVLGPRGLKSFIDQVIRRLERSRRAGRRFLSLTAADARQQVRQLQTAVDITGVKARLESYLMARAGLAVRVEGRVPGAGQQPVVSSDGRRILISDPVQDSDDYSANLALTKALVRLEACWYEFGTFELDLEKVADRFRLPELAASGKASGDDISDLQRFWAVFDQPVLAADLLTICEHLRLLNLATEHYPGLVRSSMVFLKHRAEELSRGPAGNHPLWTYYCRRVLGLDLSREKSTGRPELDCYFDRCRDVQDSAAAVWRCYPEVRKWLDDRGWIDDKGYRPMDFPFGWAINWRMSRPPWPENEQRAGQLKRMLAARNIKVYRSDLKKLLVRTCGRPDEKELASLVAAGQKTGSGKKALAIIAVSCADSLQQVLAESRDGGPKEPGNGQAVCYYDEWDCRLQDYLKGYVRVMERQLTVDHGNNSFFSATLNNYRPLVARLRKAFERLKPEAVAMLRPWCEGDSLDHRSLVEFAVDRRSRRQPSDRIFIKRLKQRRDVAVMLLVDMSRSTSNAVASGRCSVLEVEKQALVLFCQALEVVGDTYAIAGFSGTGALGVDFFRIKDFSEALDSLVQARISVMAPQRNTRMGAAVRHATALLARTTARVRLLIILGDGFPNDQDYKNGYAIADTRRAVQEAGAVRVHVRALTVNMGSDPRLDELYGKRRHYVIENVMELPAKLLQLYTSLTRY